MSLSLTALPLSTIAILIIAAAIGITTSTINRRFIDIEQLKLYQREQREYLRELKEVSRTHDKNLEAKLKKRQMRVNQLMATVTKQQFKAMGVTFLPIFIIYALLAGFAPLGIHGYFSGITAAYLPFSFSFLGSVVDGITHLPFVYWYFLCSFAVNLPMLRIFGLAPGSED
ncbi:MAG TPA: EMC3/TMCO1 family protein [archaeon]|nr:EMC3/TMCO1 family protein [archaeon]